MRPWCMVIGLGRSERSAAGHRVPKSPQRGQAQRLFRLTEEHGDDKAARLTASLAALVNDVLRSHGSRSIRWLGDGAFLFRGSEVAGGVLIILRKRKDPNART